MKKTIFDVDSNEINRILNLHEKSNKSQYLNLITESSNKGSYENPYQDWEIQKDVDIIVDNLDGASYENDLKEILNILKKYVGKIAVDKSDYYKPKLMSAIYRIRQLFYIDENEQLIQAIKDVDNPTNNNNVSLYQNQIVSILTQYNKNVVLKKTEKKAEKSVTKKDHKYGSINIPAGSTITHYNNKYVVLYTPKKEKIWYNCDDKTFSNGGQWVKGDGKLEYTLNNDVNGCNRGNKPPANNTPPPSNDEQNKNVVTPPQTGPQTGPVVDPNLTPVQQDFVNKTTTSINNLQTLLGISPTGKLDTTQIQSLIDKLNAK